jgi:2-dehydropantoate 2-reductase
VPGVVEAWSSPVHGILDVGCYPGGVDDVASTLSAAFEVAGFSSRPEPEVMRFKWSKLLMNLGNVLEAAAGPIGRDSEVYARARAEGRAVMDAAGIDAASDEDDAARRGDLVRIRPIDGERRGGGSTWQSLARGATSLEADLLNGEIVLLGRLHGVATPVNALLQQVARELAQAGAPPGSVSTAELEARL